MEHAGSRAAQIAKREGMAMPKPAAVHHRLELLSFLVLLTALSADVALGQERSERTLDEIKVEALSRAENGMYPVIGMDPKDLREAFASIKTKDKD
jgi:hypothetical protein